MFLAAVQGHAEVPALFSQVETTIEKANASNTRKLAPLDVPTPPNRAACPKLQAAHYAVSDQPGPRLPAFTGTLLVVDFFLSFSFQAEMLSQYC
jgi:hypothetical protein